MRSGECRDHNCLVIILPLEPKKNLKQCTLAYYTNEGRQSQNTTTVLPRLTSDPANEFFG